MSGGVDSSVAAALLLNEGLEVFGAYMLLGGPARGGASSPDPAAGAKQVADALGIELAVLDLREEFARVVDDFVAEYARGRTPNPCLHCNAMFKFGRLFDQADSLGAKSVATGHHARIVIHEAAPAIARARCRSKDQSYALLAVARDRLSRIVLPVGELDSKAAVRKIAADLHLAAHDRPDSQEICFLDGGDYTSLLSERAPQALQPGAIVDSAGREIGRHAGYGQFTIGQRRGIGIAAAEPLYVTHIDPATARVTVGPRHEVMGSHLTASSANWHCDVARQFSAIVQIRYNHRGCMGKVTATSPDSFQVDFDEPVVAITPGQAAAVFDGDRLLGGGFIDSGQSPD